MSSLPTLLIVHGAWHTPHCFDYFTELLEKRGFEVVRPLLPTCNGDNPPTKTLEDDVQAVRDHAEKLVNDGKDVIAILHSYGGTVGTDALYGLSKSARKGKGLEGGIKDLFYVCAFVNHKDYSLVGMGNGQLAPWISEVENGLIYVPDPVPVFYQDVPNADRLKDKLVRQPKSTQFTPVKYEAWREVPVTYLVCENDQAIPSWFQRAMIERMEETGVKAKLIETSSSSHSPFLSQPDALVDLTMRVATST